MQVDLQVFDFMIFFRIQVLTIVIVNVGFYFGDSPSSMFTSPIVVDARVIAMALTAVMIALVVPVAVVGGGRVTCCRSWCSPDSN